MAKHERRIVVEGTSFRWLLRPDDEGGLHLHVRAAEERGARLSVWIDHGNLVTPWLVREAIVRALAEGWDPSTAGGTHALHLRGVLPDRAAPALPSAHEPTEDELLAQIAGSPEDEEPRLVYADWLLDHGEAQGEQIVLACAERRGELEAEERARLEALAATADRRWLGPVAGITRKRRWWCGLLDGCQLGKNAPGAVGAALGHRAWATVREIDGRGAFLSPADIVELVSQPRLLALRELTLHPAAAGALARELATRGFALARLEAFGCGGPPGELGDLLAPPLLPALRTLACSLDRAELLAPLLEEAIGGRLERLLLRSGFEALAGCLRALEAASTALAELSLCPWWQAFASPGPAITLHRDPEGRWSSLELRWPWARWDHGAETILTALLELPPDALTRLEIAPSPPEASPPWSDPEYRRRLETAARRHRRLQEITLPERR